MANGRHAEEEGGAWGGAGEGGRYPGVDGDGVVAGNPLELEAEADQA